MELLEALHHSLLKQSDWSLSYMREPSPCHGVSPKFIKQNAVTVWSERGHQNITMPAHKNGKGTILRSRVALSIMLNDTGGNNSGVNNMRIGKTVIAMEKHESGK